MAASEQSEQNKQHGPRRRRARGGGRGGIKSEPSGGGENAGDVGSGANTSAGDASASKNGGRNGGGSARRPRRGDPEPDDRGGRSSRGGPGRGSAGRRPNRRRKNDGGGNDGGNAKENGSRGDGGGGGVGRGKGRGNDRRRPDAHPAGDGGGRDETNDGRRSNRSRAKKVNYEPLASLSSCLRRYADGDVDVVRGRMRVMPGRNGSAFVTCDRGSLARDVVVRDEKGRNRALDGDHVFVELHPAVDGEEGGASSGGGEKRRDGNVTLDDFVNLELNDAADGNGIRREHVASEVDDGHAGDDVEGIVYEEDEYAIEEEIAAQDSDNEGEGESDDEGVEMWHDDEIQMSLWDPKVNLRRKSSRKPSTGGVEALGTQRTGKVIFVLPPKSTAGQRPSEFNPEDERSRNQVPTRTIVGTLTKLPGAGGKEGRHLLTPNNRSLPQFMCPAGARDEIDAESGGKIVYRAEYAHGSWAANNKWPPCSKLSVLCGTGDAAGETKALLVENGVDHGDFPPAVLRDVEGAVKSGRFHSQAGDPSAGDGEMGWKPTEAMRRGRRDYRKHRVFTIDPTTAKDLDDALHVTPLPDGRVEIGVHIADVSHFMQYDSAVDREALRRATTVYLVNGIVPMLPRPLCEIACSLNEDVERLAFSCVWRMNMDGTMSKEGGKKDGEDAVWYGRTIIKSCARLDYATAQNIIDGAVATGEEEADETLWAKSRQPTGGHTIDGVAADVRLMHKVAMARRKLRFQNGALALNGVKLAFQLEEDGETPKLCAPYPIRDSNRLIEEYMLLANYLVAQRLITHAHGRALLRNHSPPLEGGMQQVVDVSKESFDFDIDTTDSGTLQESLSRLGRECDDELVVQCVTESLMTPMRPAEYVAAGELDEADWRHFALNIPYYTHFTSPIRRYPDVMVHRLLQATLDDDVDKFPMDKKEIHSAAGHCNDMRMSARKAQERSDRVFLSLHLRKNPIESALGVCLGVGEKTFTVFVPSLGMSTRVFLQEHEDAFDINAFSDDHGRRKIVIRPKQSDVPGTERTGVGAPSWKSLDIKVFTKLEVACSCKTQPPIDVRVTVVGPFME